MYGNLNSGFISESSKRLFCSVEQGEGGGFLKKRQLGGGQSADLLGDERDNRKTKLRENDNPRATER